MNPKILHHVFLLLVLLLSVSQLVAQPAGTLDPNFGSSGIVRTDVSTADDEVLAIATMSDNRFVVVGYSEKPQQFTVARYLANGTLDSTFGTGGIVKTAFADRAYAWAVAIQSDGKIVVGGDAGFVFGLARYTSTGQLDSTFGNQGKVTTAIGNSSGIRGIGIQSDGKIVAAGASDGDFAVARYTSSGALDTTFGGGDGIVTTDFFGDEDLGTSLQLQSDGKILVGGSGYDLDLNLDFTIARYTSSGDLDTAFGTGGFVQTDTQCGVEALRLQADGKILAVGSAGDVVIARYTTTGTLDTSFATTGIVTTDITGNEDHATAVTTDTSGILVAGYTLSSGNNDFFVMRYNTNGSLDTSFDNGDGIVVTSLNSNSDLAYAIGMQPNNGILVAGSTGDFGSKQLGIARYIGIQPTAANISISGQIRTASGMYISNATVGLTGMNGTIYAHTNSFGYYQFIDVPVGTYIVSATSKRYTFEPSSIVINALDNVTGVNFTSIE